MRNIAGRAPHFVADALIGFADVRGRTDSSSMLPCGTLPAVDGSMGLRRAPGRATVLDAALAIIDRDGLRALTIRTLASEVGVAPMTLYAHFKTKDDLLDLTFEHLLSSRLFQSQLRPTWQEEFEAVCRHVRRVLLDHPHWIDLLTRVAAPPSALGMYNEFLGLMSRDGFSPEAAILAISSAMTFTLGAVLVERMMANHPSVPAQQLALVKGVLGGLPNRTYPRIAKMVPRFERWSFDRVFDLGLHSLIAGVEERGDRRPAARSAAGRNIGR
jgi:AcrR family transcriptional regulator